MKVLCLGTAMIAHSQENSKSCTYKVVHELEIPAQPGMTMMNRHMTLHAPSYDDAVPKCTDLQSRGVLRH